MDPSCTHELRRVPSTPAGHAHSEEVHQDLTHWRLLGADTLDGPPESRHSKQYQTQAPPCALRGGSSPESHSTLRRGRPCLNPRHYSKDPDTHTYIKLERVQEC